MAINLTLDTVLSRVRIAGTGMSIGKATFQRSLNNLSWTTVRGGEAVTVSGGAASLDDYEFSPGVVNYYRIIVQSAVQLTYPTGSTLAEDMTTSETLWDVSGATLADKWTVGSNVAGLYDWQVGSEIVRVTVMPAATGAGPYLQTATVTRSINGVVTTHLTGASVNLYKQTWQTSITPAQDEVWLKSISRPFLNRPINVVTHSDITRESRNGVFPIIGRSAPVAITDVRQARQWEMTIQATSVSDADAIELVLAGGDPLYVQVPPDGRDIPGGYVVVGTMNRRRFGHVSARRWFDLPMTTVAPPGPGVVGATNTWEALVAEFGTWSDVLTAFGSWAAVSEYVADPSTVIVP